MLNYAFFILFKKQWLKGRKMKQDGLCKLLLPNPDTTLHQPPSYSCFPPPSTFHGTCLSYSHLLLLMTERRRYGEGLEVGSKRRRLGLHVARSRHKVPSAS